MVSRANALIAALGMQPRQGPGVGRVLVDCDQGAGMTGLEAGDEILPHKPCGSGYDDRPTIQVHGAPDQNLVLWKMNAGTLRTASMMKRQNHGA